MPLIWYEPKSPLVKSKFTVGVMPTIGCRRKYTWCAVELDFVYATSALARSRSVTSKLPRNAEDQMSASVSRNSVLVSTGPLAVPDNRMLSAE